LRTPSEVLELRCCRGNHGPQSSHRHARPSCAFAYAIESGAGADHDRCCGSHPSVGTTPCRLSRLDPAPAERRGPIVRPREAGPFIGLQRRRRWPTRHCPGAETEVAAGLAASAGTGPLRVQPRCLDAPRQPSWRRRRMTAAWGGGGAKGSTRPDFGLRPIRDCVRHRLKPLRGQRRPGFRRA
jgi:hypothetical protein